MASRESEAMQPLLKAISDDGANWLFIVFPAHGWAITCNGEQVASGTSSNASVDLGVRKFLSVTKPLHSNAGLEALAFRR